MKGRILALDYGKKRTGVAVTDPLQIIATPLETVETRELVGWLKKYFQTEPVVRVLIGYPRHLDGTPTDATPLVEKFMGQFRHVFPEMPLLPVEERLTSRWAASALHEMGLSKTQRRDKGLLDQTAACLLLQDHLQSVPPPEA